MSGTNPVPTPNPVPIVEQQTASSSPQTDELKLLFSPEPGEEVSFAKGTGEAEKKEPAKTLPSSAIALDQSLKHAIATNTPSTVADVEVTSVALSFEPPVKQIDEAPHMVPPQPAATAERQEPPAETRDPSPESIETRPGPAANARLVKASEAQRYSKGDVVNILESFVNLIKNEEEPNNMDFSVDAEQNQGVESVSVDDRTAEIDELRALLIEAQETIIQLLTDRVEDRARIAQLETELKLLPDFQAQAKRALSVVGETDDVRSELARVKSELERLRVAKGKENMEGPGPSWWTGFWEWLLNKK